MNHLSKLIVLLFLVIAGSFAAPVDHNTEQAIADIDITADANITMPHSQEFAAMRKGQATYYHAGLGACGVTNNGNTEDIVALPHGLMGPKSNNNPHCGRRVMISYKGKSFPGSVQDKCMGCEGNNIDLSVHLFKKFAPLSAGRLFGVNWHFI